MKQTQQTQPCHTPGPWTANADTVWRGGNPIVCHPINDPRSIADAALIASAPALAAENAALRAALAAIVDQQWLNAEHDGCVIAPALIDNARAILAGKGAT
jgi:hypothetical protein